MLPLEKEYFPSSRNNQKDGGLVVVEMLNKSLQYIFHRCWSHQLERYADTVQTNK